MQRNCYGRRVLFIGRLARHPVSITQVALPSAGLFYQVMRLIVKCLIGLVNGCLLGQPVVAQGLSPSPLPARDSLRAEPDTVRAASPRPPLGLAFNLDFRNSFILHRQINVWGVNAGFKYGAKRHQVTVGYYWLTYQSGLRFIDWQRITAPRINFDYYTQTDLSFVNLMYWWNLVNTTKWMVSIPFELGGGVAANQFQSVRDSQVTARVRRDFFMPAQVGIYGEWRMTRWVGFSSQVGYRRSIFQTNINSRYNGLYYSAGVVIYPQLWKDIYHKFFPKSKLLDFL